MDSFEAYINGFTDDEYEDWIDGMDTTWKGDNVKGASDLQAEIGLNIREPLSETEKRDMEDEQRG